MSRLYVPKPVSYTHLLYNRTSHFVHIDTRGYKVYWRNKGNATCETFGLGKRYEQYKAKEQEEDEMTQEQFNKMMDAYLMRCV